MLDAHLSSINSFVEKGRCFELSRATEFSELVKQNAFALVSASEAAEQRIFGSQFVYSIKKEEISNTFETHRLFLQAYNNNDHRFLAHASMVQRVSQRLLMTVCATDASLPFSLETYRRLTCSLKPQLNFSIFVCPPAALKLPAGFLLRVERPSYDLPDAIIHCYRTYHNLYVEKLSPKYSTHDPCFLYTLGGMSQNTKYCANSGSFTLLQTDDIANVVTVSSLKFL